MIQTSLQKLLPAVANSSMTQDVAFTGVSTDSRHIAKGNLFVALRGEHFDAHDFLNQVAQQGAAAVVAERLPADFSLPALLVPDTKMVLAEIARFWRQQFSIPVIGVTGSNGKTTVKEMIASILRAAYGEAGMIATKGNLNNEIGVPLTTMRLASEHQAAVIELGMNHPGEIALLTSIACPTVGLVNNAQREHQEFMQSVEAVAIENGAVIRGLPESGVAVFPSDDTYTELWRSFATESGVRKVISFGLDASADLQGSFSAQSFGNEVEMRIDGKQQSFSLAAAGQHNVMNALAAAACCYATGISLTTIAQGLQNFAPVAGRLQPKQAACGARVIDDTYNANPDSVKAAIEVLAGTASRKILVLGDMGEVGQDGAAFHQEIGAYAKEKNITLVFTLGALAEATTVAFGAGAMHFNDIADLFKHLQSVVQPSDTVLLKGSRFMKMERVVAFLVSPDGIVSGETSH